MCRPVGAANEDKGLATILKETSKGAVQQRHAEAVLAHGGELVPTTSNCATSALLFQSVVRSTNPNWISYTHVDERTLSGNCTFAKNAASAKMQIIERDPRRRVLAQYFEGA